jgi:single-stranded-DNA-specific exonuclease
MVDPFKLNRSWQLAPQIDRQILSELSLQFEVPAVILGILTRGGYRTGEEIDLFLNPRLENLESPFKLSGMATAVERIVGAVERGEKIVIYGDYDVDGVTSVALLFRALKAVGGRVDYHIPHRLLDGYGLSSESVERTHNNGAKLVITVDCGVTSYDEVELARKLGMEVVVTDHHHPQGDVPEALAVINPKLESEPGPFYDLAGVGLAFKLAQAVYDRLNLSPEEIFNYLDLVALGIVADVVPLTGENRILAHHGLARLPATENTGLKMLLDKLGFLGRSVSAGQILFSIAPRISAMGRMSDASRVVELLVTDSDETSRSIVAEMENNNILRRELDNRIYREAEEKALNDYDPVSRRTLCLSSPDWHAGVIGIVASRLVETFHRPTVLICEDGDESKGSARSIPGFDLYRAMERSSGHLAKFGGHTYAVGLTIEAGAIEAFREEFETVACEMLTAEDLIPKLFIDDRLGFRQTNWDLMKYIKLLSPFGHGNRRPVFLTENVEIVGPARRVGNDHLKLRLRHEGVTMEAIGFGMGSLVETVSSGCTNADIVYILDTNEYQGRVSLQLKIKDIRIW